MLSSEIGMDKRPISWKFRNIIASKWALMVEQDMSWTMPVILRLNYVSFWIRNKKVIIAFYRNDCMNQLLNLFLLNTSRNLFIKLIFFFFFFAFWVLFFFSLSFECSLSTMHFVDYFFFFFLHSFIHSNAVDQFDARYVYALSVHGH